MTEDARDKLIMEMHGALKEVCAVVVGVNGSGSGLVSRVGAIEDREKTHEADCGIGKRLTAHESTHEKAGGKTRWIAGWVVAIIAVVSPWLQKLVGLK